MTTPHDPAAIAARLTDVMLSAITRYPEEWTREKLPIGWSGTAIGRVPLVDVDPSMGYARRLNRLGLAVRHHLENGDKA